MLESKRGSMFRAIFAILGTVLLFIALYFLNQENFLHGGILGIIGILFITVSIFPYMKFTST